jgi:phosphoglucan,water dikinase
VLGGDSSLDVICAWGKTGARDVRARKLGDGAAPFEDLAAAMAAAAPAAAAAGGGRAASSGSDSGWSSRTGSSSGSEVGGRARGSLRGGQSCWGAACSQLAAARPKTPVPSHPTPSLPPSPQTALSSADDVLAPAWQGREVVFMRSNDHSRERRGTWDTSGLAPGPVLDLVEGDRDAANWLAKLGVARKLLVDAAPRMRPDTDALAAALVYLSWVNSGAVACAEGGGHHRPNHHARTAQAIFRSLEWAIEEDRPRGPAQLQAPRLRSLLARRLHARLPSFDASFTQSVPLTRIRDIAHRSDIPHVSAGGGVKGAAGVACAAWGLRSHLALLPILASPPPS